MRQGHAPRPREGNSFRGLLRRAALLLPAIVLLAAGARAATPAQAAPLTVLLSGTGVSGSGSPYTISTQAGQQVTLAATPGGASCGSATYTYAWTFGDGTTGPNNNFVVHSWTTNATGNVVVIDNCGSSDSAASATFSVTIGGTGSGACTPNPVTGNPISVSVTASPTSATVGQTITFLSSANDIGAGATTLAYTWSFGDGTSQAATQTTSHSYTAANTYTVTATVTDNLGRVNCGTTTVTITGSGSGGTSGSTNPKIQVAPNGPYTGSVGQAIQFGGFATTQDAGATITGYSWNFGDNTNATGQSVQHTYSQAGTFTVTLTATDSAGQSSSNTTTATIGGSGTTGGASGTATTGQNSERGVTVNTGGPYTGSAGTAINFTGTATTTNGGATITSYVWSFGDGGTATGQTASHTYANSGNFTLTLTATDSTGVAVAATAVVTIGGGSSAGPRTVQLVQGCNNVALTFPDNTQTTTVANGVSPASALLSVWKLSDPASQKYKAFFPGATQATDLPTVNRLDAVFICVNAAATFTEPGA